MNTFISEDKRILVSSRFYISVASHNSRVYATNFNSGAIEIYGHNSDTWWGLRRIHRPFNNPDEIRLWVNDKNIYISSWKHDSIFLFNHDGKPLVSYGNSGSCEAGQLNIPLLCHGDDDGDVLIADILNQGLQVLHSDGHFSVVNIQDMFRPQSAVYTPGRLYVLDEDPVSSKRSRILVYLPDQIKIENLENEYEQIKITAVG